MCPAVSSQSVQVKLSLSSQFILNYYRNFQDFDMKMQEKVILDVNASNLDISYNLLSKAPILHCCTAFLWLRTPLKKAWPTFVAKCTWHGMRTWQRDAWSRRQKTLRVAWLSMNLRQFVMSTMRQYTIRKETAATICYYRVCMLMNLHNGRALLNNISWELPITSDVKYTSFLQP